MPFLHVTSRIKNRAGDDLLRKKYGHDRFPTILFLDSTGDALHAITRADASLWGRAGMPVGAFARKLDACERYVALRKKAAAGDASAKVDLAVAGVEIGKLGPEALDRAVAGVTLTPAQARAVAQARANVTCERLVRKMQGRYVHEEQMRIRAALLELYRAGTHPTCDSAGTYWWVVAQRGRKTGDVAMMKAGRRGLRAAPGGGWQFTAFLAELEKDLRARQTGK